MSNVLAFVDNSEDEIFIFQRVYSSSNLSLELKTFTSGSSFLDYINDLVKNNEPLPKYIFMDINMPEKNGFETIEDLFAIKSTPPLPAVTFFTNSSWEKDAERAQLLNAQFKTKPDRIQEYIEYLNSLESA